MQISLLWTWNRTIDRVPYLLTGFVLFLVKFAIDWTIATQAFGQAWSLQHYLVWPNEGTLQALDLTAPGRWFALTMLFVSLPFIWIGVILTLHRLRAAALPLGLVVLFFVPAVNLLLFLILALATTREPHAQAKARPDKPANVPVLRRAHHRLAGDNHLRSAAFALSLSVPLTVLGVFFSAQALGTYGFGLFVGAPFALGMCSVMLFGLSKPQPFGRCILVAVAAFGLAGLAILLVALEGFICLLMASPIAFVLTFLGALVGYTVQRRPWLTDQATSFMAAILFMLPALMAAEWADEPEPNLRAITTEVIVSAPLDKVWQLVISFPELPAPDDWLFQAGVAYPLRAEIHGTGVGAVRHCIFSTGTFVEPIEVWDAPVLLRFRVTEQPPPMHEWTPYHIHPPHLDRYLVSKQGQFLLERLADGRTRLEGTTWYTNRMWPAAYWNLWSDSIIQRIHRRVLEHIRRLAEG